MKTRSAPGGTRLQILSRIATVAFGTAIVTGSLQVAVGALRHAIGHDFIWLSREYVWMVPAGYAVLFLVVALLLSIIASFWTGAGDVRVPGFVFGTLGALGLTLLVPGLHHLAALAVALGTGTRVAAWLATHTPARLAALRRLSFVLVVVLAGAAVVRAGLRRLSHDSAVAALPPAAADAPNVLVIILDTVRAASMSFMGYDRTTTPHLARLGAEGAVFEEAFSTAPWTLPSHAGMFTGLYPSQTSTDWREPLEDGPPTLAEALAANGYRTGAFVANHFYTSYESGIGRGFQRLEDYRLTMRQMLLSTTLTQTNLFFQLLHNDGLLNRLLALARMDLRLQTMWTSDRKLAPHVTSEFIAWQARGDRERPFFAFLNLYDAHLPYDPPAPWRTKFGAEPGELDLYDGAIAYIDDTLGHLFEELRSRGLLDRTLIVVTSDHGELFGEHGLHGHGNSLYLPELHVPLVLRYPARVRAGVRVTAPVTLRDLMATVLDVTGASTSSPGVSWLPLTGGAPRAKGSPVISEVRAGVNTDPAYPVSRGPMQSAITDSTHYIRNGDGVEELYAWRADRPEANDLVKTGNAAARLPALRAAIAATLSGDVSASRGPPVP